MWDKSKETKVCVIKVSKKKKWNRNIFEKMKLKTFQF